MKKKYLSFFAFLLVIVPTLIFAGCGDTPPPPATTYNVSFSLQNAPSSGITIQNLNATKYEEGSNIEFLVTFSEGYRPEGMEAKLNSADISGTFKAEDGSLYNSTSTPYASAVTWTYTLTNLSQDTQISVDVAQCRKAIINYTFDEDYLGKIQYAIFANAPDEPILTKGDLDDYLSDKQVTLLPISTTVSVPYGAYVMLFSKVGTLFLLMHEPNGVSEDSYQYLYANYDNSRQMYFNYPYQAENYRVFGFSADKQKITHFEDIFVSTSDTDNLIANTFSLCPIVDGTNVRQMTEIAPEFADALYAKNEQEEKQQTTVSFVGGETKTYYRLTNSTQMLSYIGTSALTENLQKSYVNTYSKLVEEDLIFEINGFGSFGEEDRYYLSNERNFTSPTAVKVDVSDCIKRATVNSRPAYYFVMTKERLAQVIQEAPALVKQIKTEFYGFAYLIYDKNSSMTDIHQVCLEGYAFEDINPTLMFYGNSGLQTLPGSDEQVAIDESYGYLRYADYTTTNNAGEITPVYTLSTLEFSTHMPTYKLLQIVAPILKITTDAVSGSNIVLYDKMTFNFYDRDGNKLNATEGVYNYTATDFANMSNFYVYIDVSAYFDSYDYFKLVVDFHEKAYDTSEHVFKNETGRTVYCYTQNYTSNAALPVEESAWTELNQSNTPTLSFTESKLMYFLVELTSDEDSYEVLNIDYMSKAAEGAEPAKYTRLKETRKLTDLFNNDVTVTIGDTTYSVYVANFLPFYYPDGVEALLRIAEVEKE